MTGYYQPGPPTTLARLASGVEGIKTTLRLMRQLVQQWKTNPGIRQLAVRLTQGLPQQDYSGEVRALHAFVRDKIRYVGDTSEVETLHTPQRVLEQAAGDCDDKAILLSTLLEAINHKTRFIAAAFHDPGVYEHVWIETALGGQWYPLETTKPVPAGWSPPGIIPPRIVVHN